MAFDPCREWLGIDAVDLATPHRVLDVAASETDAAAIRAAADRRLAALQRIDPGPFARAQAALVRRIEEARDAMLANAASAAPPVPAAPPAPSLSFPRPVPPPRARVFAPPVADPPVTGEADAGRPPINGHATIRDDEEDGDGGDADDDGAMLVAASPQRVVRPPAPRTGSAGLLVGAVAMLAAGAAVLAFVVLRPGEPERKIARGQPGTAVTPAQPTPRPKPQPPSSPEAPPASPQPAPPQPPPAPVDGPPPTAPSKPAAGTAVPAAPERPDSQTTMEAEERARAERDAAARERQMAEERARVEAEAREREMREAEERRMAEERERSAAGIDMALRDAYSALRRQEFDTCDRAIASARKLAGDDPEAGARIESWALFAAYAKAFPGYRDQALAAANAGRDYDVGSKRIAMIEITAEMVVYKEAGKTQRVPRDRLDPEIILAIVTQWFEADGRAANHLFLGAYHLANDPPDLRRARAEWDTAGRGGETVAPLLSLLDDPVIRRAAGAR